MRNIAEYPVTKEEIASCLVDLSDSFLEDGKIGDMRPYLLGIAAQIVIKSDWKQEEI
jgi:hypothetical protein